MRNLLNQIVFDFKELSPIYKFTTATVVLTLSVAYWLVITYGESAEIVSIGKKKERDSSHSRTVLFFLL